MSFVDRSGTNWSPLPKALNSARPGFVVAGGVATIMGTAYLLFKLRNSYAGALPNTMNKEWADATAEKIRTGMEREAGDPIPLNPISQHKME